MGPHPIVVPEAPGAWVEDAACHFVDPLVMVPPNVTVFPVDRSFNPSIEAERSAEALRVCVRCPVQAECREWSCRALPLSYPGIYGGLLWSERQVESRRVRRGRRVG